jgi:hypothetical protein
VPVGSVLRITGAGLLCSGSQLGASTGLLVQGRLEIVDRATVCFSQSSVLTNEGVIDVQGDGSTLYGGNPGVVGQVINKGILTKSSGAGKATFTASFTNSGTVQVNSGVLTWERGPELPINERGAYSIATGTELDIRGGGRIWGDGTTISGGGTLAISAPSLELQGGVAVNVGVLSVGSVSVRLASDTLYPTLHASVSASIASGASLSISSIAPYCPAVGKQFPFLLAPSVSGSFSSVNGSAIGRTFTLSPVSGGSAIVVSGGSCDLTPPTITGPLVQRAITAQDSLLEGRIGVSASDAGTGVKSLEYQWWTAPLAVPTTWESTAWNGTGDATISYADASPNSTWTLRVRAVDGMDNVSPELTLSLTTPPAPYLVAIGDSVTAGHHRDSALSDTKCEDPAFSYANRYYQRLKASVPSQWAAGFAYDNFASSGYTTNQVLGLGKRQDANGNWDGDLHDACGAVTGPTLNFASAQLTGQFSGHANTWKRAVMTVGVNNTNWSDKLKEIFLNPLRNVFPGTACQNSVNAWDGWDNAKGDEIRNGVAEILRLLDPIGTRVVIPSYFPIAGSGAVVPWDCSASLGSGLDRMNSLIQAAIAQHVSYQQSHNQPAPMVRYVDVHNAFDDRPGTIQTLYTADNALMLDCIVGSWAVGLNCGPGSVPGWPHPNQTGANNMGDALPINIFGWGT